MQAGLIAHERLYRVTDNRTLWERNEIHLDGDCHFSNEFEDKPDVLRQLLARAVNAFAGRTANEIRYPRATASGGLQ